MGSNIKEFIVSLEFTDQGELATATYWDQEGCGHTQQMDPEAKIVNMVDYHLAHYKKSHRLEPRKRCPMAMTGVDPSSQRPINFRCTLEPHSANVKHQLEQD